MKLENKWVNATRTPEERVRIELTYRDAVLDYFDFYALGKAEREN